MCSDRSQDRSAKIRPFVPTPLSEFAGPDPRFVQGWSEALGAPLKVRDVAGDLIPSLTSSRPDPERPHASSDEDGDEYERPIPVSYDEATFQAAVNAARAEGEERGKRLAEADAAQEQAARRAIFEESVARLNAAADALNEASAEAQRRTAGAFRAALERMFGTVQADPEARARVLFRFFCDALREQGLESLGGAELYVHPDDLERVKALLAADHDGEISGFKFSGLRVLAGREAKLGSAELRWLRGGLSVTPDSLLDAVREVTG